VIYQKNYLVLHIKTSILNSLVRNKQVKIITTKGNAGFWGEEVKSVCIWAWELITPEEYGNKNLSLFQCNKQQKKTQMKSKQANRSAKPNGRPMVILVAAVSWSSISLSVSRL